MEKFPGDITDSTNAAKPLVRPANDVLILYCCGKTERYVVIFRKRNMRAVE